MAAYAHPEVLVDTSWVKGHIGNETVRIVEVDYDPTPNYNLGHIPGSVLIDWKKDINDPVRRDIVSKEGLEALFGRLGISNDHQIVLYGDFNNWFAAFAFWVFKYYGVENVVLLNGGRKKWIEQDLPVTKDVPSFPATTFTAKEPDETLRVYLAYVREAYKQAGKVLVDVRGPKEFSGEILAPPEYPTEHAQRGGHIPGAKNIPWAQAVNEDGTFKAPEELKALYEPKGVTPDKEVIAYCRIGERSSHTWFVLKYLLGYPDGQNDEDRSQQEGANGRALVQVKSVPYDQKSEIDESKPGKHPHEQDEKEHVETTRPSRSWGPGSRRRAFRPIGRSDGATRRRCHYCCAPFVVLGAFHGLLIDGNTFCNPLKAVSDNLSEEFQGSDENFTFPGMFSARGARGLPRRK